METNKKIRILVVAHSVKGRLSPFVVEQMESLLELGLEIEAFGVEGKGMWGYLGSLRPLKRKLAEYKPDIVHAYYGLTGLLANLQRKYPVITSYLGSDIHKGGWVQFLSKISIKLSVFNIFVAARLYQQLYLKKASGDGFDEIKAQLNSTIIPCGVQLDTFYQIPRSEALRLLNESGVVMDAGRHYVVFAGAFSNMVKNPALAKEAVALLADDYPVELIELKGYTRNQVNWLLNAADCLLMTSDNEGSPMIIKEAMAAGCPVVSVDAGDVAERLGGASGCYIAERNPSAIATAVESTLQAGSRTDGREFILLEKCDSASVANKLLSVYRKVLKDK